MPNKLKEKVENKDNKILNIQLDNYSIQRALAEYLSERKVNIHDFGGLPGYMKAIIDVGIKDKELKENLLKALQHYIGEHFWAGVFLAKTKPDSVKIRYDEIKEIKGEDNKPQTYLG